MPKTPHVAPRDLDQDAFQLRLCQGAGHIDFRGLVGPLGRVPDDPQAGQGARAAGRPTGVVGPRHLTFRLDFEGVQGRGVWVRELDLGGTQVPRPMSAPLLGGVHLAKLPLPQSAVAERGFHLDVFQHDLVQAQVRRAVFGGHVQQRREVPRAIRHFHDLEVAARPSQGGQFWAVVPQGPHVHFNPNACGGEQGVRGCGHGECGFPEVHADVGKAVPPRQVYVLDDELPLDLVVEQGHALLLPCVPVDLGQRSDHARASRHQGHHNPHNTDHFGWGCGRHGRTKVRRQDLALNTSGIQVFT